MMNKIWKKQNGDTIVEVLISLAILTLVLWGAYYTANQSFRTDRDSQEHTEALTVAQTQVEGLRALGASFNPALDSCINSSLTPTNTCQVSGNNTNTFSLSCPAGTYCYTVVITAPPALAVPFPLSLVPPINVQLNTYKVDVSWMALTGGNDDVTLYYRVQ
jgi:type II secretory pathway pseudopilin PulG